MFFTFRLFLTAVMTPLLQTQYLQTFLASTGPFFHGKLESINKNLPSLVSVLCSVGVGECWQNISLTIFSIYVRWFRPPQARSGTPLTKKPLPFQFFFSKCFEETRLISLINRTGSTVPVTDFYGWIAGFRLFSI